MILKQEQTEIKTLGIDEKSYFTFDSSHHGKVFRIISKSFYSDPIGSIVRELSNNAWDSYIGTDKTPRVQIEYKDDYLYFIDEGTGMSKDFMLNEYIQIGHSTKEENSVAIGCFGLGNINNCPF